MIKMVIAMISVIVLSGCSALPTIVIQPAGEPTNTSQTPETTPAGNSTETSEKSKDELFEEMVRYLVDFEPTAGEIREGINVAHETCSAIDRGVTVEQMIQVMFDNDISIDSRAGQFIMASMVAATKVYCTEHSEFFSQ